MKKRGLKLETRYGKLDLMISRIGKFFVGVLLLPFCWAVALTVVDLVTEAQPSSSGAIPPSAWALGAGFVGWLLVFLLLPRPVRTYVLAHELTHALWGAVMGAKISGMKVSKERGSVTLSKTNFLITLAPYFFPLYTVLVIVGYYILLCFIEVETYELYWLGLVGVTWSFHFTFTVTTLLQKQSDIRECGHLFSYAIIFLFNAIGIALWVVLVSTVEFARLVELMSGYSADTLRGIWAWCSKMVPFIATFRQ